MRVGTLEIASTWDGRPVASDEAATIEVDASEEAWIVRVDAPFHGDPAPPGLPASTEGLWEYEVVELFVAGEGLPVPYVEIELSPHGHWLVLQLLGVRMSIARGLPLVYAASIDRGRWRGVARIPRAWLPSPPWRWNGYAIHGSERRYLAATPLPGAKPNFHQPERFARV